jgi:hypothetical protein
VKQLCDLLGQSGWAVIDEGIENARLAMKGYQVVVGDASWYQSTVTSWQMDNGQWRMDSWS